MQKSSQIKSTLFNLRAKINDAQNMAFLLYHLCRSPYHLSMVNKQLLTNELCEIMEDMLSDWMELNEAINQNL